jgi:hypothetical protein
MGRPCHNPARTSYRGNFSPINYTYESAEYHLPHARKGDPLRNLLEGGMLLD